MNRVTAPSASRLKPPQRFVRIEGRTVSVPTLALAEFCHEYHLSAEIHDRLDTEGFETAGALLEISEATLKDAKLRVGQIGELKRALKDFLLKNN
ncbi:hypothetical protein DFH09DRAFT_1324222 [Mycena vulgaris]|nr:hypothetical protein DFH09DRAFT_1374304 [Mycena vulgaris]KAJ6537360.1 hypothetical protein DFH09DRAFT_1324222 [Mycena vulgaris]